MKTYWCGWVQTYQDGRSLCAASFIGETLEEALADAFKTATYYLGLEYQVVIENIHQSCYTCSGAGEVKKERGTGYKVCPACKGKKLATMGNIPVVPSETTKVSNI